MLLLMQHSFKLGQSLYEPLTRIVQVVQLN